MPPAQLVVAQNQVQVLTVHAAKGLEWQVVAVPHLSTGVFPSTASARTWLTDAADLPPLLRGDRASAGAHGVPVLDTSDVTDRKQLSDKISAHRRQLDQRRLDEERRLLYVAITRAEDTLLLSGYHWGATGIKPRGPSDFLSELKDIIDASAAAGEPCGVIEHWAPAPADGDRNPLRDSVHEAVWPVDPLGGRRADVERGAALVTAAMSADPSTAPADADPEGWVADVDALLAEHARGAQQRRPTLPSQLSVSGLVELARDPEQAAQRLVRRLPARPDPHALLGNAFHDWVQRFYGAERLIDLGDLPGAADTDTAEVESEELAALQAAFVASPWAARTPWRSRCRSRWRSATPWCGAASTPCSPTPTAAPPSWTGRPVNHREGRRPPVRPLFSSACTGWPGPRYKVARNRWCARRFTTCAAVSPSSPTCCRGPTNWPALLAQPETS